MPDTPLERARDAFTKRAWLEACERFLEASESQTLELPDLELLAWSAVLSGRDEDSDAAWTSAHRAALDRGDPRRAARDAFWLALSLIERGEMAPAGGWIGRARHVLDGHPECAEDGLLAIPIALQALGAGEIEAARDQFADALEIGVRFGDPDLMTLGRLGGGQARVELAEVEAGLAMLDEAMVAVTSNEVTPIVAGITYCAVIEICQRSYDFRRAREWTEALSRWCDAQPQMTVFRGRCLVYRSEMLQLSGLWDQASDEVTHARTRLLEPKPHPAAGAASYQRGELHRLRGEPRLAEAAYREASERGHSPDPGLALLRLSEGRVEDAAAVSRRVVAEATGPDRFRLLAAHIEIMLAAGQVEAALLALEELGNIGDAAPAPARQAVLDHARASVGLETGNSDAALIAARASSRVWRELGAPYEEARARVQVGLACRALGDDETAGLEFDAAHQVFQSLGAGPDIARLNAFQSEPRGDLGTGLTGRELEVLRLVAAGLTNRAVAAELTISDRTVARHVSNILTKLDLPSRSAATAYAYEHELI